MSPDTPCTRRETLLGLASVAFAGVMWGTIPLVLRAADGASVVKVFYRVVFAALAIFLWMLVTRRLGEVTGLSRRKLGQVALQGVILTVNWVLFLSALDLTNVATAELLGYTGPVFVAMLAPFVTGERFDARIILPLGLSLGGIVVILAPQGLNLGSGRATLGALLAFASALTYATLMLRSKNILRGISAPALMLIEYVVAGVILLPFAIVLTSRGQGPTHLTGYLALLSLGIVQTALTGAIFLTGLRRTRTDHAAVLTYTEPVCAVLFAAAFLAEPLGVWSVVGDAMVIIGGLTIAQMKPTPSAIEPVPLEAAGVEGDAGEEARTDTKS
ncbi:MAG: DMT family transporter [Coriobacteriia bacterium]|nr:DMT family transporter [Coriobacteriia bacterium]